MYSHTRSNSTSKCDPQTEPFLEHNDVTIIEAQYIPSRESYPSKFRSFLAVFIVTSLLWLTIFYMKTSFFLPHNRYTNPLDITNRHNITSYAQLLECGNSTQEAISRGCEYDVLLNNWVPGPCVDHEFVDEYLDDNSWTAYADENLTQRLSSVEEMYERDFYFTSLRDHINHCSMIWKKQFWVLYQEYSAFDTIISSPSHTDHCAFFLSDAMNSDMLQATKVEKGYAGCWIRN